MTLAADGSALPDSGFISDGVRTFSLAVLRGMQSAWDAHLGRAGISPRDCIAVPVRSDVRSAVTVLALLARGQSMLLWRQSLPMENGDIPAGILPSFCRYALVDSGSAVDVPDSTIGPGAFHVAPCARAAQAAAPAAPPFVYVATSGTTGVPKIAVFQHDTLLGNARNCIGRLRLGAADRIIIPVPLAHMYGLGAAFLPAVQAGAGIRLVGEANLVRYLQAEAEFEPTVAFLTPSFCHLLLKGRKQARPYRLTVLAGDLASERTFADYEQRHGCTVNLYGSTELGVISAGCPQDSFDVRRDTVGKPLPGVRLAPPAGESLAAQAPGELFPLRIDHPYGCAGYADDAGHPSMPKTLYEAGWYNTRDLGRLDGDGRIRVSGRFDHAVKRDGVLVAFADVERVLLQVDGIDRTIVLAGDAMTPRGRELVAVCIAVEGASMDAAALGRVARRQLPGHAVPDRFVFLKELPLTATAKPDRVALGTMISATKEDAANASSQ
jgi:acyl-coenzyme A synthetase/AMP-(fatty) acid ligase